MSENLEKNISPTKVAEMLHMGCSSFRHNLKALVGVSPSEFIQDLKHNEARMQLITSSQPISDIAYKLGFDGLTQFSLFFKRREGISLSEYRKLNNLKTIILSK